MNPAKYRYVGDELESFAHAVNWKAYLAQQIRPYLGDDVLEVGAGLGATAAALCSSAQRTWTALEPDAGLAAKARNALSNGGLPAVWRIRVGDLGALTPEERFDSVLYVDVLEHIERDAEQLLWASRHLRDGGHLVVLSPAHQWLYSPFDRAIGHWRRYTLNSLLALSPPHLVSVRGRYLDSLGLAASLANKVLLRQRLPTPSQVRLWDRAMIPLSRLIDACLSFRVGKSVLVIWQRR